ncbi:chorismate mutase [Alkalihalobacillus xiaoxiensis]|uniref:Chorismate mutase n=1 Tax=Shouchella xiaoxiensis TaxID=766895 RepID=A0ABS2SYS7_9BACI|nr:chorismate mutase [Shouchella xiaoxiensis]
MSVEIMRDRIQSTENFIESANDKINRLRACRARLIGQEITMGNAKHKFKEPELTKETWYGKHANEFDEEREAEVVNSYNDLLNEVGETIEKATREIQSTQDVISHQNRLLSDYKIGLE